AVERADPDAGAAGDLLERRRLAAFGERLASSGEHLLVVAAGVGALRARQQAPRRGVSGAHGDGLDKTEDPSVFFRRTPPVISEAASILHRPDCLDKLGIRMSLTSTPAPASVADR